MLSLWVCEGWWFSKASTAYSHLGKRRSILALLQLISMKAIVVTSAFLHRKGSTLTSADSARSSNQCDHRRSVPIFKPQHLIFFPFWSEFEVVKLVKGKSHHWYYFTLLTSSNRPKYFTTGTTSSIFLYHGYYYKLIRLTNLTWTRGLKLKSGKTSMRGQNGEEDWLFWMPELFTGIPSDWYFLSGNFTDKIYC